MGVALGHALVNDIGADLRQTVDVVLAGAVVPALDRVVEEAVDGVAVVDIIGYGIINSLNGIANTIGPSVMPISDSAASESMPVLTEVTSSHWRDCWLLARR